MPSMDELHTALRNADAAGDVDAARKLAAHIKSTQGQVSAVTAGAPAQAVAPLSRMEKIGRGMRDPIDGGAQLLANLLPKGMVDAGNRANNWVADKTGLVARIPEGGVDQLVRQQQREYEARRVAGGESGIDGYRLLGNVVSPANAALALRAPAAASLVGRVALGAGSGAASGALAPVGEGDFWSEKGKQAATGAAVGGALPTLLGGLARVVSPNASKNPNVALLRQEGVTPTIGQAMGGAVNKIEERSMSVPFVGDAIRSARGRANGQFQAATHNRALEPIGQRLPEGLSGREAVEYTEGVLRQSYDDVLHRIGAIPADQAFASKLASLGQMVNRAVLSRDAKQKFGTVLSDVQGAFGPNGMLTSDGYKTLESALGSDFRKLTSSQDIYDGRLAPAVKQLQQELRDLLKRQAGPNADELAAVNSGWANFKRVQRASGALGAQDGQFSPAQFQNAVKALDKSKDKGAFARGSALGQDLGDAGKAVLTNTVANSGTADRLMNAGAIGSWFVNPAIPLSALGGAGLYLPAVQRALVAAAASRPAAAEPTAKALRKVAPMFIPGAAQLGVQARE